MLQPTNEICLTDYVTIIAKEMLLSSVSVWISWKRRGRFSMQMDITLYHVSSHFHTRVFWVGRNVSNRVLSTYE